jgi:hypothetical protein
VICGPACLSGLSDQEQERWRLEWRTARHGDQLKRIEGYKKQFENVNQAVRLVASLEFAVPSRSIVDKALEAGQGSAGGGRNVMWPVKQMW